MKLINNCDEKITAEVVNETTGKVVFNGEIAKKKSGNNIHNLNLSSDYTYRVQGSVIGQSPHIRTSIQSNAEVTYSIAGGQFTFTINSPTTV